MDQQAIIVRMTRQIIELLKLEPPMENCIFLTNSKMCNLIKEYSLNFYNHFTVHRKVLSQGYILSLLEQSIEADDKINFDILFVALNMCKELMNDQENLVDDEEITLTNKMRELLFAIFPYANNLDSIILQI